MKTFIQEMEITGRANEKIKEIKENTVIYSSEEDDKVYNTLLNINETWGKAPLIMATPSITVGNSYAPKIPDINNVWIKAYPTCIIADTFQGHMRVRHLKDNILYFSIPDDKILHMNKEGTDLKFKILSEFDNANDRKREIIVNLVKKLIEYCRQRFAIGDK